MRGSWRRGVLILGSCALLAGAAAPPRSSGPEPGLLFHLSADHGLTADYSAGGAPEPNFASEVTVIPDGAAGPGLQCGHTQLLSYWAPGSIHAQRGTLAFFWRSREPVGPTPFPVFRVGYADHSSWDMVWLRIDYNGKSGFDAFVTDASFARARVSYTLPAFPSPSTWTHLVLTWDETRGMRFDVNGQLAGSRDGTFRFDAALDQFGPHSRIISPYQVQSAYNFVRGGDIDELRIYDRMLDEGGVAALARGGAATDVPRIERTLDTPRWRDEDDVQTSGTSMRLTVHSLGAVAAPAARVVVRDGEGREIARAAVPALQAPLDLSPRTATVIVKLPAARPTHGSVAVELAGSAPEITQQNNVVRW